MLRDFSKEEFDIIIQAGQSNSEGTGYGPAETPYERNDDTYYLNPDFSISQASELVEGNRIRGDFSLSFATAYRKAGLLREGRKLLIVRAAVGGTGFSDRRWGPEDDLFIRMMALTRTALALHPGNRPVALLWHQGETDSTLSAGYDRYYAALTNLVRLTREAFGQDLPFIAGDFVEHWRRTTGDDFLPIQRALRAVCRDLDRAAFVETDGLLSNAQKLGGDDTIHFCRDALGELGNRYFKLYSAITAGGQA